MKFCVSAVLFKNCEIIFKVRFSKTLFLLCCCFPFFLVSPKQGLVLLACFSSRYGGVIGWWFCCYPGTSGTIQEGSITRGTPSSKLSVDSIPSLRGSITQVSCSPSQDPNHSWWENQKWSLKWVGHSSTNFVTKLFIVLGFGTGLSDKPVINLRW